MTKINNKGFLLAESLVVSTFVLTVLTLLFVQFKTLFDSYKNSYNYNKVEAIYNLGSMVNYFKTEDILDKLPEKMENQTYLTLYQTKNDPKGCNTEIGLTDVNFCNSQAEAMGLKTLLYTSSSVNTFKDYLKTNNDSNISQSMKDFINRISLKEKAGLGGRVYAQFDDGSFATISTEVNIDNSITPTVLKNKYCNTTSGDGLYADPTEEGRCVYKGVKPDNYIKFNGELWRIVSFENDGSLKIVKDSSIGNMVFDPGYEENSSLRKEGYIYASSINETRGGTAVEGYCKGYNNTTYSGCKIWGSKTTMLDSSGNHTTDFTYIIGSKSYTESLPDKEAYLNTYLNNTYYNSLNSSSKLLIINHMWNVGDLREYTKGGAAKTLEGDLLDEKKYKWNGKIALLNPTDYVKSISKKGCDSTYLSEFSGCSSTTWLTRSTAQWLISPYYNTGGGSHQFYVWALSSNGGFGGGSPLNKPKGVYPSLYLTPNITLTGTGAQTDPYIILEEQ